MVKYFLFQGILWLKKEANIKGKIHSMCLVKLIIFLRLLRPLDTKSVEVLDDDIGISTVPKRNQRIVGKIRWQDGIYRRCFRHEDASDPIRYKPTLLKHEVRTIRGVR
jgi:hypothetical protein